MQSMISITKWMAASKSDPKHLEIKIGSISSKMVDVGQELGDKEEDKRSHWVRFEQSLRDFTYFSVSSWVLWLIKQR